MKKNVKYTDYDSTEIVLDESIKKIIRLEEVYDNGKTNFFYDRITPLEFNILNDFLFECFINKNDNIIVTDYGETTELGAIILFPTFYQNRPYFFNCIIDGIELCLSTLLYNNNGRMFFELCGSSKIKFSVDDLNTLINKVKKIAFNNSKYKGKCITVHLDEGRFDKIEIINLEDNSNKLILSKLQKKFIDQFITSVKKGNNLRYLFNGEPGTGKTETMREIARNLLPDVTFIIPEVNRFSDLKIIFDSCQIFDDVVIMIDDIDLVLGSRDNNNQTANLGGFLSLFDGIKKQKFSVLASTNDKKLVDKAAERPGRFNFILDYSYLEVDQVIDVCKIHLPDFCQRKEVYDILIGNISGKKAKITGAFIANLAVNIKEMSESNPDWKLEDTLCLIRECYQGFYHSQTAKETRLGF